jgi:hypothetical protein
MRFGSNCDRDCAIKGRVPLERFDVELDPGKSEEIANVKRSASQGKSLKVISIFTSIKTPGSLLLINGNIRAFLYQKLIKPNTVILSKGVFQNITQERVLGSRRVYLNY